jgi:hypothetical protein
VLAPVARRRLPVVCSSTLPDTCGIEASMLNMMMRAHEVEQTVGRPPRWACWAHGVLGRAQSWPPPRPAWTAAAGSALASGLPTTVYMSQRQIIVHTDGSYVYARRWAGACKPHPARRSQLMTSTLRSGHVSHC